MSLVATLITDPARPVLTPELADSAAAAIGASSPDFLAEGVACDLALPVSAEAGTVAAALRENVGGAPIDVIVQPRAGRRKRLLLADMDSTIIGQECIDELADLVGLKAEVAAITARAMNGEIAFEPALRERVALLEGLALSVIDEVLAERIMLNPGAEVLIATMKHHGARAVLVSGGFTAFTAPVAAWVGFDEHHGNVLLAAECRLTGQVAEPILGRQAKRDTLLRVAAELGIGPDDALAVGDGANDLGMLELAGMGVAIHAKPAVAAAAPQRIEHGDLTALLYLQGFRRDDFIRA